MKVKFEMDKISPGEKEISIWAIFGEDDEYDPILITVDYDDTDHNQSKFIAKMIVNLSDVEYISEPEGEDDDIQP